MLEKLGPTFLAGVPAIVKPASSTAYVTEACVRIMLDTGLLPDGALQFIAGSVGDLLEHLNCQDVVSFTGSAATAQKLQSHPVIARESVRFVAERDSLNATVLGPDCTADTPEFELFVKEVVREMTVKAGQKCTAIRRTFVPPHSSIKLSRRSSRGFRKSSSAIPRTEGVTMGALVSERQLRDVRATVAEIAKEARIVFGDPETPPAEGAPSSPRSCCAATLPGRRPAFTTRRRSGRSRRSCRMATSPDAIRLCNRGQGSLVMSLFTHDPAVASRRRDGRRRLSWSSADRRSGLR